MNGPDPSDGTSPTSGANGVNPTSGPDPSNGASPTSGANGVRIQKLLARAGICSRRTAEIYLAAGRVSVNGYPAVIGQKADPVRDVITFDGEPLPPPPEYVYILLNKPRGVVTTLSDEQGRPTVGELVHGCGERVFPVGRLDMDSEGLLLLTNDGALARLLTHPSTQIPKTYELTIPGNVPDAAEQLTHIQSIGGERIRPARVKTIRRDDSHTVLSVTIREGKNRQIRRMCEERGFRVLRLRRVREHTLSLGKLKSGEWRYLTAEEVRKLRRGLTAETSLSPPRHGGGSPAGPGQGHPMTDNG